MKLYKNDRCNKSSLLALKFCHPGLCALALGLYTCINHEKNLCKIRVSSSPSETNTANDLSDYNCFM